MNIAGVKQWRSVLILAPIVVGSEQEELRAFNLDLKSLNPNIHIDVLHWQQDRTRAKSKEYVRSVNELNDTDFSWLGKLTNTQNMNYFVDQYDCMIVLANQLPEKVRKLNRKSNAHVKIGFEDDDSFTIVFKSANTAFSHKIQTLRTYLLSQ